MNTGISDAVDLAWKIEAVTSGWASSDLLKTYEEERSKLGSEIQMRHKLF